MRLCLDCKTDISHTYCNTLRCVGCRDNRRKLNRKRYEEPKDIAKYTTIKPACPQCSASPPYCSTCYFSGYVYESVPIPD